tara:strand:+ start:7140 stop:8213 length:1074 start_codon:yes stop_codon:yes gene_type:complete
MIKIKLVESGFHTLFPYKKAMNQFKEIGIEIILPEDKTDSFDFAFVDHQSFSNKKVSLEQSTEDGLNLLSKINGDYILVDGQDSPSLIGTFEVFKESNALLLLKHSMYKDRSLYNQGWIGGRWYWGTNWENFDELKYQPTDYDEYSDRIRLSGTNWLGVNPVNWLDYKQIPKLFDVSAMFGFPSQHKTYEHMLDGKDDVPRQDYYYDEHRRPAIDILNKSPYMIAKLVNGKRVPMEMYNQYNLHSKVLFTPFGFGEMHPRDIESAMYGSILLKPDMSHIDSHPFVYEDGVTYVSCKHDFSDLEEKIEYCVENFNELRDELVTNMRNQYTEKYNPHYLPLYTYNILKSMSIVQTEEGI